MARQASSPACRTPIRGAIVATCCNATERDVVEAHATVAAIAAKGNARGIIQRSLPSRIGPTMRLPATRRTTENRVLRADFEP
jgi:hypothetical protein